MDCCYMSSKNLSKNQKRPEFFWFFALLQVRVPSKNQKNLEFFSFFKVMTKKKQKNSRKTKKKKTWASDQTFSEKFWFFGFLVFSRFGLSPKEKSNSWLVPLNLEKTKKPKNQNFSENVWSEAHVWFLLVFLEFFVFFGHDLEKTKKTQGFFGFLDKLMVKELWNTKKIQVFFWFFAWIVATCLLKICPKTKKDLSFFGFLPYFK